MALIELIKEQIIKSSVEDDAKKRDKQLKDMINEFIKAYYEAIKEPVASRKGMEAHLFIKGYESNYALLKKVIWKKTTFTGEYKRMDEHQFYLKTNLIFQGKEKLAEQCEFMDKTIARLYN